MPFILPANTLSAGGYNVDNSLRFNTGSSDYLNRSASGSASVTEATISVWIKRASTGGNHNLYNGAYQNNNTYYFRAYINSDDQLEIENKDGSTNLLYKTNRKFRDLSAWYNIVIKLSLTASGTNRCKVFINGVQETSFATQTAMSGDQFFTGKNNYTVQIGETHSGENDYFNGYMSEFVYVQGTALDPTSFGEFDEDSGIFKPIDVSGLTFGSNGFYQEYKQAGTGTNSSGMGADTSGNDNHFAVNNLTAVDQSTDTCTNNFATMNPLDSVNVTLSEGNLSASCASSSGVRSTIAVADGKFYAEVKFQNTTSVCGVAAMEQPVSTFNGIGAVLFGSSGSAPELFLNGTTPSTYSSAGAFSANDIMQIALDMDSNTVYFGKNGSWFGGTSWTESTPTTAHTLTSGYTYGFVARTGSGTSVNIWNFGSPSFAISSSNADGNGYGNFEYAVPSGYYSLNTKNLAEFG